MGHRFGKNGEKIENAMNIMNDYDKSAMGASSSVSGT